jgi:ATP-dependent helicase HrpA
MTFKVIDVHDRIIDQSRDLEVLKRRHSGDAGKTFQKIASQAYLHTGLTHWSFGDLGDSFDGEHEGQKVYGFPAVVDEGETIGVRVFESPEAAAQAHELGVSRLLRIVLLKEIKYIKRQLVIDAATELSYRQLQGHPFLYSGLAKSRELREDLLDRLVASVFLEGQPILRSAGAFDDRVRMARSDLLGRADQMAEAARKILDLYRSIQKALAGPLSAVLREDIEKQLGRMIYQGFWVTTSWLNLCEMPRYLGAILNRLQKAPQDPQKDLHQLSQIAPFLECYWTLVEREQGRRYPERDAFRWLLEEFRVSLFAQQLKTLVPVSGKRMADGWALLNGKT